MKSPSPGQDRDISVATEAVSVGLYEGSEGWFLGAVSTGSGQVKCFDDWSLSMAFLAAKSR